MILDKETLFSIDQEVTDSAPSSHSIDLSPIKGDFRDIGIGEPLHLFVSVSQQLEASAGTKVQFVLETSSGYGFTVAKALYQSAEITIHDMNKVKQVVAMIPHGVQKYLRLRYVVTGGAISDGAFTAGIVLNVDAHPIYNAVTN